MASQSRPSGVDATMAWSLFDQREWLARTVAVIIGVLLLIYQDALTVRHLAPRVIPPVQIKLISLPVEQPPKVEVPQPHPLPPKTVTAPKPVVRQIVQPQPAQQIAPAPAVAVPVPAQTVVAAQPTLPDLPVSKPESKPVAPARQKGDADSENGFTNDVRKKIEQQKVYPASARELGMAGVVEVRYVIDRSGRLLEVEVATSSGYPLLDRAAVRAVKAASFKAMMANSWPDEAQKEFRTKIVFSITD
jgi:periplasmic protein TonB